jgi:cytochrome P450
MKIVGTINQSIQAAAKALARNLARRRHPVDGPMAATNPAVYPPGPKYTFSGGYLVALHPAPLQFLTRLAHDYGDICHFRIGRQHVYLVNHPDFIKEVLVTQNNKFHKGPIAFHNGPLGIARRLFGSGLLTSEGELHHAQRQLMQPAFHRQQVAACGNVIVSCGAKTAVRWQDGQTLDVAQEMMRLTLQVAGKALFNVAFEREAKEAAAALTEIAANFDRSMLPFTRLRETLPTPATLRCRKALARLEAAVYQMMNERRTPDQQSDLLSMLMLARDGNGDGRSLSDVQVRDEICTFMLAGNLTITNALTWTWYLLSQHPDVEQRLHAELDMVLQGELPTAQSAANLSYTRMILCESMRLFPPVWFTSRRAIQDCDIGGYRIPANAVVMTSQYLMHRDPRYYPDPNRFDPLRWTTEAQAQRPKFAYFPFAAGPRVCIGEPFAWMEGILLIATLAQRWRMQLEPNFPVLPLPSVVLRPKSGMRMTLHRRSPN